MDHAGTDTAGDTLTAFDFAIEGGNLRIPPSSIL